MIDQLKKWCPSTTVIPHSTTILCCGQRFGVNRTSAGSLARGSLKPGASRLADFELIDKEEGIFKSLDVEEELANNMIMEARKNWFD